MSDLISARLEDSFECVPAGTYYHHNLRLQAAYAILETVPDAHIATGELREGLISTPGRAAKAWAHWLGGYDIDPASLLTIFEDGSEGYDEIVMVKDLPFYSHCEHHLAPFFGRATIGYIPGPKGIIGLSKAARILDAYARRLQVQERMTTQIANTLWQGLAPVGVAVQIRARHMCMESRGICLQGHTTTTQALQGVFRHEPAARAEFIELAKSDLAL